MAPEDLVSNFWNILKGEFVIDGEGKRHDGPASMVRVDNVEIEGENWVTIQGWGDKTVHVKGESFKSVVQKEG